MAFLLNPLFRKLEYTWEVCGQGAEFYTHLHCDCRNAQAGLRTDGTGLQDAYLCEAFPGHLWEGRWLYNNDYPAPILWPQVSVKLKPPLPQQSNTVDGNKTHARTEESRCMSFVCGNILIGGIVSSYSNVCIAQILFYFQRPRAETTDLG